MQDSLPQVTVIIPCYNREDYIAATIESVLNQTWPRIELIVVDDGSSDKSRVLIETFGTRLILLEHPGRANKGQSASLNLGLRHCKGEYVAILDSDDLFAPQKIEKQVRFLEHHRDIGVVYANGKIIDEHGRERHGIFPADHQPPPGPEQVLMNCPFNVPSNSLVRRTVYDKVGFFDETLRSAQDHDIAIRMTEVATVGYLNECLWYYRRHDGSVSRKRTMERWLNGFKILDAACRRYPYPKTTRKRRLAVLNFRVGQCYLEEKNYLKTGFYFLKAGLLDPPRSLSVICGKEPLTPPYC